jgi:prevent-host-death family protein
MTTINVHAAKTHFSSLLERVAAGEEIVIAKAGKPVARLTALAPRDVAKRRLGLLEGRAVVPADFDAPLPDAVLDDFEGL